MGIWLFEFKKMRPAPRDEQPHPICNNVKKRLGNEFKARDVLDKLLRK